MGVEGESYLDHLRAELVTDDNYKARPCCSRCGSTDVTVDATARWDIEAQAWMLTRAFDSTVICPDCDEAPVRWETAPTTIREHGDAESA